MTRITKKPRRILPKVFALSLLLVAAYVLWVLYNTDEHGTSLLSSQSHAEPASRERASNEHERTRAEHNSTPPPLPGGAALVFVSDITDTQYLKLVNRNLAITTAVSPALLVPAWPDVAVRATDIKVHETAMGAIRELFSAAHNAGIRDLFIASGFRSFDEQRALYESIADKHYVMPAGHSEHELGLSVDILFSGSYDVHSMSDTPQAEWLEQNAPRFGLILRYPDDKQHITDVAYEPWHFRYVGRVHAWIIGQHDFVLEEYISFLQNNESYQVSFDGMDWYILYQEPVDGMIFVPSEMEFSVSDSNIGGYIVTAWR